ncbi:MAG: SGNH/GDSL hydrolase family protein, partial [Bacteroidetes bacterium]|nr:SGNH/GDSL hydrolase family protein [Bacteroidota bacterium]
LQLETRGIVVGNIPDVSTIPFFTTIGPIIATNPLINWTAIAAGHAAAGLPGTGIIYVKKTGLNIGLPFNLGFSDSASTRNGTALFTLIGQTAAGLLGDVTGIFYSSTGVPPGVDITKPFGFHPQNPFPDAFILDPDEITIAKTAVDAFNAIIAAEAGSRNIAVVDFNTFLKNLQAGGGISVPGIGVFSSSFITGGTFSYDGVHPSSRGYGIIANEWISVINQKFGATIPPVDLNSIPGMPIGKLASGKFPNYPAGYFDNYIRMITGDRNWSSSN